MDRSDGDNFRYMAAMIRHFLHVDPYRLSPREFAVHWREAELLMTEFKPLAALREL